MQGDRGVRTILAAVITALAAASAAHAASVSIVPDKDPSSYWGGDTVTLTIIATADQGETTTQVFGELLFSDPTAVSNLSASQVALQSFDGAITWLVGAQSPCDPSGCTVMNQIAGLTPLAASNTPLEIATVTFTLGYLFPSDEAPPLSVGWNPDTFDFFGASVPADVVVVAPEPGTAGLLALGLIGIRALWRRGALA